MIYLLAVFMLLAGIYSFTYGISLWKDDRLKLGSIGVIVVSVIGTLLPLVFMFWKH